MEPAVVPSVEEYDHWAQVYLRQLPLEHFMEAVPQATQRAITVASMELVGEARPEVQTFSELLVQYPRPGEKVPGQVVPDNMVVVHPEPIVADGHYSVLHQPARPFWVLEYVSKSSSRKDYEDNRRKYEEALAVPYYLLYHPESEDLTLLRLVGGRYRGVLPNDDGRLELPELDLEIGLLDGWARYWFRGTLLPLPAEMQRELRETRRERDEATRRADEAARQRDQAGRERDQAVAALNAERQARADLEQQLARLRAQLAGPNAPQP